MDLKCKSNAIPMLVGYLVLIAIAATCGLIALAGEVLGPLVIPADSPWNWLIGLAAVTFGITAFGVVGGAVLEQAIGIPLLRLVGIRVVYGESTCN